MKLIDWVFLIFVPFAFLSYGLTYFGKKRDTGKVLVLLGRPRETFGGFFGIGYFLVRYIERVQNQGWSAEWSELAVDIIPILMATLAMGLCLIVGLQRQGIWEGGIVLGMDFVKWDKIRSYEWSGKTLTINTHQILWFHFSKSVKLRVPIEKKDPVDHLLAQHITTPSGNLKVSED